MALSGTFYGTTNNQYIKPKITWTARQDVAGNYSDITATLSYSRTNSGYTTKGTWSGNLTIGDSIANGTAQLSISHGTDAVAITHTARIYHDAYGEKTVTISAAGGISGTSLDTTSIQAQVKPDTIPRASTITATDASIGSATTIVVGRKNAGFTHSIFLQFGDYGRYLTETGGVMHHEVMLSTTMVGLHLPEYFYEQIPNGPSGLCYLTCTTYSGTTRIGTNQCTFQVTADPAKCSPTLESHVEDVNPVTLALTGDPGTLVRYVSTARCTVTATAQKGASIVLRQVDGQPVTQDYLDFPNTQRDTYQTYAQDSRGYKALQTVGLPMIPYVRVTANAAVQRLGPTSDQVRLSVKGNFFAGSFGAVQNSLTLQCRVGADQWQPLTPVIGDDGTYTADIMLTGLDYTTAHYLVLQARDGVTGVEKTLTVNPGIPVFDWGQHDFAFHVPVTAPQIHAPVEGTVNGISLCSARPWGENTFTLQTKYPDFSGAGGNRQSVMLTGCCNGTPILGTLVVDDAGNCGWQGSQGITFQATGLGRVQVLLPSAAYDHFILLSAEPISIP